MSEADRIAKARHDAERHRLSAARRDAVRIIDALIPEVLAALASRGYPSTQIVRAQGRLLTRKRAAWWVVPDSDGFGGIVLLSTGELASLGAYGDARRLSRENTRYQADSIIAGLRRLLT